MRSEPGRTVLFVDDEPSIITLAGYALERAGLEVLGAHSGRDALRTYTERHHEIDVVVLDYMLPDMRGDELLARLCEIDDSVPLVAMSGYSREQVDASVRDRVALFLCKPFDLSTLAVKLNDVMVPAPV